MNNNWSGEGRTLNLLGNNQAPCLWATLQNEYPGRDSNPYIHTPVRRGVFYSIPPERFELPVSRGVTRRQHPYVEHETNEETSLLYKYNAFLTVCQAFNR